MLYILVCVYGINDARDFFERILAVIAAILAGIATLVMGLIK